MGRIRVLPDREAERIAAGEVVERPASVARELVHNSLDAGATRIRIELGRGGLGMVRVSDDGHGMDREDTQLALQRHATSKINGLDDLAGLRTLGFRGEALASIAAVSRLEIISAAESGGEATRVLLEGGSVKSVEPASRPRGTTVVVSDLFYNTPARQKFLKSPGAEFSRVSDVLLPEFLAHPVVGFELTHDGREAVHVAAGEQLVERIGSLWGADLAARLVPVTAEAGGAKVQGFLSGPDDHRGSRRHWYLFVNSRPVRDRLLIHAATRGVGEALPRGRYPSLFLFVDLPGDEVDVNVHPAKSEVRFRDASRVHGLVAGALRQATQPAGYMATGPVPTPGGSTRGAEMAVGETVTHYAGQPLPHRSLFSPTGSPTGPDTASLSVARQAPRPEDTPLAVLAQYRDCFIVAHDDATFYLIDQHVAHERILYEQLRDELAGGGGEGQALLFPVVVDLRPGQASALEERLELLASLSLDVEVFGQDAVMVRQVPACLSPGRAEKMLRDLVDDLLDDPDPGQATSPALDTLEHRLAATVACHAAVKIHFSLTREKMEYLVRELFRCREPLTCPHGRQVVLQWPHDDILRAFGRI